jgi:hypothetical protein
MTGRRITLTLVPLADPRPVEVRLRNLLKTALRRDRLKCVSVEGIALEDRTRGDDDRDDELLEREQCEG